MLEIQLANGRRIENDAPCFIIAEIGANHNRSLSLAKEMIDAAAEAKADAVKFQIYSAENLYSRKTPVTRGTEKTFSTLSRDRNAPNMAAGACRVLRRKENSLLRHSLRQQGG